MSNDKHFQTMPYLEKRMNELFENYHQSHSKMLVVRADIRYPQEHGEVNDNTDISKAMAKTMQSLKRDDYDPACIWVREKKDSDHPHYHAIVLADGQKTRSAGMIHDRIEQYWQSTIKTDKGGLIDYCYRDSMGNPHKNGTVITRQEDIPEHVQSQMGYLAKPDGKGQPKDGLRDFGMSRLKKK